MPDLENPSFTLDSLLAKMESGADAAELIDGLTEEEMIQLAVYGTGVRADLKKLQQLVYYNPVSPRALQIHLAMERECFITGGNRSAKTDTVLADFAIRATGIVPISLLDIYPKEKLQCPMRFRIVCESLTNTWEPVIKPKLQWDQWNGRSEQGGAFGHWGWIPRRFLIKGKWDESWSEKFKTLTLTCGCTFQIMSYDQDVGDFSGSSKHAILHDEPPSREIYKENMMRTIDTKGQIFSCFTPPDDPAKAIRGSWIYEFFEKGQEGPGKDPNIKSFTLFTEENEINDPAEIEIKMKGLSVAEKEVRMHGAFMHLTGRIYPLYTDVPRWWCFGCNALTIAAKSDGASKSVCAQCGNNNITEFCHFVPPEARIYTYPVVWIVDPHPRKPVMMAWIAVDPIDDPWIIKTMEIDESPTVIAKDVEDFERGMRLSVVSRLMDPNMGESQTNNAGPRHVTVRRSYDAAGLRCAMADDNFDVGSERIKEMLKPDARTKRPRIHVFNTCHLFNKQMKSYIWGEWSGRSSEEKDAKALPRAKNDDYPTILKYFVNQNYRYSSLQAGMGRMRATRQERTSAYG